MEGGGEGGFPPSAAAPHEEGLAGSSGGVSAPPAAAAAAATPLQVEGNEGSGALPIPPLGWAYKTSKTSGKHFLYHKETKRTAWTIEEIML